MRILIIGSGGREHALAWKAASDPKVDTVFVAPGNAGTAAETKCVNIPLGATAIESLIEFAQQRAVDLTIVGPEAPLVAGIVDQFNAVGLRCFGPSAAAAQLEGSKAFAKDFMQRHDIPTAAYGSFTDIQTAKAFIRHHGTPIVIKADGLAAGKGVIIAQDLIEAEAAVDDMLAGNAFGDAGHRVVIEEFLSGEEASFIVLADGSHALPLATSQDHKAVGAGDTGPNTGGMGAYSPAPVISENTHRQILDRVIQPTIDGMRAEGNPFTGFLYAGLMISANGDIKVLEYNVRFGDPETQPVMLRLQSSLVELCLAALDGTLDSTNAEWDRRASLGVVLAAAGYPGSYPKHQLINGLDSTTHPDTKVFHAGTAHDDSGAVLTNGGRVLCVCALGESVTEAQQLAYQRCQTIHWDGMYFRPDIGYRAIAREQAAASY